MAATPSTIDPPLIAPERSRLAGLLAEAFDADPMQRWLFPDDRHRPRRLRRFYELDLVHRLERRARVDVCGQDGAAFWHPPGDTATVPLRAGLAIAPAFVSVAAHHPVKAVRVLAAVASHRPTAPHWYVSHLAVAASARGTGLGGRLLSFGADRAATDGVGIHLETANPANLRFYGRHGFAESGVVEIAGAPPVWLLWRPPPRRV